MLISGFAAVTAQAAQGAQLVAVATGAHIVASVPVTPTSPCAPPPLQLPLNQEASRPESVASSSTIPTTPTSQLSPGVAQPNASGATSDGPTSVVPTFAPVYTPIMPFIPVNEDTMKDYVRKQMYVRS